MDKTESKRWFRSCSSLRCHEKKGKYSEIPDEFRYKITIEVMDERNILSDISYTFPTIGIVGKRILLAYTPASSNDEKLLLSQAPDTLTDTTNIPSAISAYLIKMKPQIVIENQAVATGSSIGMGKEQTYRMIFHSPAGFREEVENPAIVGSMYGIAFDISRIPNEVMRKRIDRYKEVKEQMETQNISLLTSYDIVGELLNLTSLSYYYQLDTYNELFARKTDVFHQRVPSEAIAFLSVEVTSILGFPYAISANGFKIDVDRDMEAVFGKDGDSNRKKSYNIASGIMGSEMEARVLDQVFSLKNAKALSATRILSIANERQIPIYTINSANISQILPLLQISKEVKSAIQCVVDRGMEVIIPRSNITYNGWEGIGYIAMDPETGEGAYMVEGIGGGIIYFLWWVGYVFLWICVAAGAVCLGLLLVEFLGVIIGVIAEAIDFFGVFWAIAYYIVGPFEELWKDFILWYWPMIKNFFLLYGPLILQHICALPAAIPGSPPPYEYPQNIYWCIGEMIQKLLDLLEEERQPSTP